MVSATPTGIKDSVRSRTEALKVDRLDVDRLDSAARRWPPLRAKRYDRGMSTSSRPTDRSVGFGLESSHDLLNQLTNGVYLVDRARRIQFWNRGAEELTGYAARDLARWACSDNLLMHVDAEGRSLCRSRCPLAATMDDGQSREVDVFLHHRDGQRVPVLVRTSPIRDSQGQIIGGIEVFDDNSARAWMHAEIESLRKLALVDSLTEVGNRRYVEIALASRHAELERYGWPFGVLLADVDHFKAFNDRHGHATGDRVLRMVAQTLAANMRSYDVVGRWGGEEFLVVMEKIDADGLAHRAEILRSQVSTSSVTAGEVPLSVTVSIGGTVARNPETVAKTVHRADELLYQSKTAGRNRCTFG